MLQGFEGAIARQNTLLCTRLPSGYKSLLGAACPKPRCHNPPSPATAPGRPSRARKQTRKKASQDARHVAAVQVKARKKVERQQALERKDMKQQEARRKAHNAKQKEVSQLWQDEVFLGGYEVDLPIRSSQ